SPPVKLRAGTLPLQLLRPPLVRSPAIAPHAPGMVRPFSHPAIMNPLTVAAPAAKPVGSDTVSNSNEFPYHNIFQVTETLRAYPATVALRDIALGEHIWAAGFHELCPAPLAVIVLPCFAIARILFELLDSPSRPL